MMVCYTCNVNKCLVLKVRKGGITEEERGKIRKQAASQSVHVQN